jgi:hypothetical protein
MRRRLYWSVIMSFGIDSSISFVMDGNKLVDVIRHDDNADKKPLDTVEEEVYRIFHAYDTLKKSRDKLVEVMHRIDNWAKAYPLKVFPELTQDNWKQAAEVLKANGLSLDRLSASNMRHVLDEIKEDVKQAIAEAEKK